MVTPSELWSYGVIYLSGASLPEKNEKDEVVKASVYMPRGEYIEHRIEAVKAGSTVSSRFLRLIRVAKAFMDYDLRDFLAVLRGRKPDYEWIMEEVEALRVKANSTREYYDLLLDQKRACKDGRRYLEIKEEIIDEKLDELEHLLEEEEG
jgi:hypothetical protein